MSCEYCKEFSGYPIIESFINTRKGAFCHHCNTIYDLTENPVPLTLEQLREMDGQPIWVVFKGDEYNEAQSHWCFVSGGDIYPCDWQTVQDYTYPLNGFGTADTDLCAYTHPPTVQSHD